MRRKRQRSHRPHMPELSLTPLIDTFATLLIIFIVAAPMVKNGIKVDLPQGKTKEASQTQDLVLSMNKEGQLYFNSFPVEAGELTSTVQKALAQKEDAPVYIRADQAVEYGRVIEIVDQLKLAGARYVAMSTRQS